MGKRFPSFSSNVFPLWFFLPFQCCRVLFEFSYKAYSDQKLETPIKRLMTKLWARLMIKPWTRLKATTIHWLHVMLHSTHSEETLVISILFLLIFRGIVLLSVFFFESYKEEFICISDLSSSKRFLLIRTPYLTEGSAYDFRTKHIKF